jgi:multidrug efflux system membrane fusion protein
MTSVHLVRALAVVAAIAVAAAGCGHSETATRGAAEPAANVTVVRPSGGRAATLVLPARVAAREEVTLTARLAARLTRLPLREGDHFRRGQTLASFDAPETRAALEGARAGLAAATTARDLARRQEARMDSLYAVRVAALRELEGARAERQAAEAAWSQARAQLDQMESGTALTAPFDGVVVRRHADPGATLGPGESLLDLRSDAVGEVVASVPESELDRLAARTAEFQIDDGPWRPATLARVDGMTDFATRSRGARFHAAPGERLEAGAFARVRLPAAANVGSANAGATGNLAVPSTALVRRGELAGVFVVEDGVARLRWLRLGAVGGGAAEVLAGLAASDQVIADPSGLTDGRPVTVAR